MSHQVFICHASEDKAVADAICAFLEQERIPCWIAPRDILPADDYGMAIVRAITTSRLVVLVFSGSANASPHIRRELELAVSNGIPILPFRVEDEIPSESLQYYLGGIHWLDALTPPLEQHLRHLAGTVRVLLERDEPATTDAAAPAPAPAPPAAAPPAAPPRRSRALRWSLIGAGLLVLLVAGGIALAFGLGALGGGSGQPEAGPTASEAATDDDAGDDLEAGRRACELIDQEDLEAVYGPAVSPPLPFSDGYCAFAQSESLTIWAEDADESDLAYWREAFGGEEVVDLPELGGGAFQDATGALTVLDPNREILILLLTASSEPEDHQRLVDLAELIIAGG